MTTVVCDKAGVVIGQLLQRCLRHRPGVCLPEEVAPPRVLRSTPREEDKPAPEHGDGQPVSTSSLSTSPGGLPVS